MQKSFKHFTHVYLLFLLVLFLLGFTPSICINFSTAWINLFLFLDWSTECSFKDRSEMSYWSFISFCKICIRSVGYMWILNVAFCSYRKSGSKDWSEIQCSENEAHRPQDCLIFAFYEDFCWRFSPELPCIPGVVQCISERCNPFAALKTPVSSLMHTWAPGTCSSSL